MTRDAALTYWRLALLWLLAGCALGVLTSLALFNPGLSQVNPVFGYGRLVSAHRAAIIHGALFSTVFACAYSLIPRLSLSSGKRPPFGTFLALAGTLTVAGGVILILLGRGSGWEYSDLPVGLAFLFWLILFGTALDLGFMMIGSRALREHPSLGLILLAGLIPSLAYPFTIPGWWGVGLFAPLRLWIGWRTIFLGSFTAAAIGIAVWTLGIIKPPPRLNRGAFMVAAILLAGLAPFTGALHMLDTPISSGLKALGAFAGFGTGAGLVILAIVLWRNPDTCPVNMLMLAGLGGLCVAAVQGIIMTIPPVHTTFHYTFNTSGHTHLALGAVILIMLGGGLLLVPRLSGRSLVQPYRAVSATAWFGAGILLVSLLVTAGGIIQAVAFRQSLGPPAWLNAIKWMHAGVLLSGIIAFTGVLIVTISLLRTSREKFTGDPEESEQLMRSEALSVSGGEE